MEAVVGTVGTVVSGMAMGDKDKIGKAIGRIASGVFIVTAEQGGKRDGLLASWVNQAAFNPPMIMAAVKKERHILDLIGTGNKFTLNVLSKNNMDIFKNFVKPFHEGLDRFEGLNILPESGHGPILANAIAYLNCITVSAAEAGDHMVILGEILSGDLLQGDSEPMIHLRKNGFQY